MEGPLSTDPLEQLTAEIKRGLMSCKVRRHASSGPHRLISRAAGGKNPPIGAQDIQTISPLRVVRGIT